MQESGNRGLNPMQEQAATAHRRFRDVFSRESDFAEKPFSASGSMRQALKISGSKVSRGIGVLDEIAATLRAEQEAAAEQAKLRAVELQAESIKEFLRGQFLNQFIETGNYDRKAAAAEFKAKYNPYAEEEKADIEADQQRKEAAETTPVATPTDVITPDAVTSAPVESEATVPVVPEESPTPRPEATAPEIVIPAPATVSAKKPFLPSDSLLNSRMRRAIIVAGFKPLPGIETLDYVAKKVKLRAAQEAESTKPKKGLIERSVNFFLGRKFFGRQPI